ncbi:ATP-binding cassette domain-containing protein [Deinococcus detaillensis]|uniref:ATP-binding cassette domain-containing protein n=1 Tax=Deinococcus detaillensis TaxID=2592048 RepID=A0A553UZI6_9DEIO|nr:ABC transporter transmembrane domain-containing protein [Deinococcus detaillensis]TSA85629.1 ATP-binding cassette domain-containing protein [Deinococcus detaillensis]
MFSRPNARAALPDTGPNRRDPANLLRLLHYVKPYVAWLSLGIFSTLISAGLSLVFPKLFGNLIDASFLKRAGSGVADTGPLDRIVLLLLGVFAVVALFTALQSFLISRVGVRVVADLRRAVFSHLLTLSPRFFATRRTGELTSRLTSDVSTVQTVVSSALAQLLSQVVTLIGGVTLMVLTSFQLSLFTLAVIPLIIGTAVVIGLQIRKAAREVQDKVAAANASAEEAISGVRVVQSFTAEDVERERYGEGVEQSFAASLRRIKLTSLMAGIMTFLAFGSLAGVLWYGGRQVLVGAITPGKLVSFLFYALQVGINVGGLTGIFSQVQEALGASSRLFELLDTKSELPVSPAPQPLDRVAGRVQFENVSFRYGDEGELPTLSGLNLDVSPGQTVALVGPSGAGKSTLVSLLPRFYDVTGGTLKVDGVDVRQADLEELRRQVGLVPQETLLFSGSVAENILYGRPSASQAEVEGAARAANAEEFILRLPQGYATAVGERGVKLSGGQRQRVAIARAILKNPRILILDEATSALDNESEALVQDALEKLMVGRTTFVIAHRLSTIRSADLIVVMDAGRAVQRGTHAELIAAGGLYKDLYDLQFRAERREQGPLAVQGV